MKRTERKVEAEGMAGKMITDKVMMVGTDVDAGTAAIHASEDNIDRMMIEIESSKKSSSQLKDTLRKEREKAIDLRENMNMC